jgi:Fe-S-cluster-containing dehydrogenase component
METTANKDTAKIKEAVKRRKHEVYKPVVPDMQLGFVHNNVDCIGCRACEMACKDKNGLPPGPLSVGYNTWKAVLIQRFMRTKSICLVIIVQSQRVCPLAPPAQFGNAKQMVS